MWRLFSGFGYPFSLSLYLYLSLLRFRALWINQAAAPDTHNASIILPKVISPWLPLLDVKPIFSSAITSRVSVKAFTVSRP